jgi:predicted phage terminase large subunit-like protein
MQLSALKGLTDAEHVELEARLEELNRYEHLTDEEYTREMECARYEATLATFARKAWEILEPGTELTWSWHYDLLCEFLTCVAQRTILRGIINVPPRTAKSFFATIVFPCWVWTWQPEHRFLFASHAARLSIQHSVKRRLLIESQWYQALWGRKVQLSPDQNEKREFTNTRTGAMFSTSVGALVTGVGGNTLVLDDGLSPDQAKSKAETETCNSWIDDTWMSRFNDPATGAALIVEQRTSLKDPTGSRISKEPAAWNLLKIPLVAEETETYLYPITGTKHTREAGDVLMPSRFTPAVVASIKARSRVYNTQYQQSPTSALGGVYKIEWWRYYRTLPTRFDEVVASWDMTFKKSDDADYVVGQLWGRLMANHYLIYQVRRKMSFPEAAAEVVQMSMRHPQLSRQLIEAKANGPAIIAQLESKVANLIPVEPQGSKYARAEASSGSVESGNVYLPGPAEAVAPWVVEFVDEHTAFTGAEGETDDQVDAQSQYINWQRLRSSNWLEIYGAMATQKEGAQLASKLTLQQKKDREALPWSTSIRVLAMGITPTEPLDKWELERWALDCRNRGELEQAENAESLLESMSR